MKDLRNLYFRVDPATPIVHVETPCLPVSLVAEGTYDNADIALKPPPRRIKFYPKGDNGPCVEGDLLHIDPTPPGAKYTLYFQDDDTGIVHQLHIDLEPEGNQP